MQTKNVPLPKYHQVYKSIRLVSRPSRDLGKLTVKLITTLIHVISSSLSNATKRNIKVNLASFRVVSLSMVIMLCCVFQNMALGDNKLIDSLAPEKILEKSYSLDIDQERKLLQVNGTMEIGILSAFKNMLSKHPELTQVEFNSNGGNIYQARGLAKIIISNALNTYVSESCYSACTIAYVAGKTRSMSPHGRLGFHQYNMKSKLLNQHFDVHKEQAKDLSFFKSRISDNNFIEKIFNSKNADIWIPEQKDLLITGVIHEIVIDSDR